MNDLARFEVGPVQPGVPLPNKSDLLAPARERVQQLNVGDSFEFRVLPIQDPSGRMYEGQGGYTYSRNAFARLQTWARQQGIKITARWLERAGDIEVARIWRVA
jgi:hypothetical protein